MITTKLQNWLGNQANYLCNKVSKKAPVAVEIIE